MKRFSIHLPLIVAFGFVYFFLLAQTTFIAWPEILTWPYLTNNGLEFYQNILSIYPPFSLRLMETFAAIFGWGVFQYQIFTWLILGLTTVLTGFVLFDQTKSPLKTWLGLVLFIMWQIRYEGNGFWFDHALPPLLLLSYYFLVKKKNSLGAIFLGLALLSKQTAIYAFIPAALMIVYPLQIVWFVLSVGLTILLGIVTLIPVGFIDNFFHQAVEIAIFYLPKQTDQIKWPTLTQLILSLIPFVSVFSLLVFTFKDLIISTKTIVDHILSQQIVFDKKINMINKFVRTNKVIVLSFWVAAASLGVFTRFELFHLQPAFPFLVLLFVELIPSKNYSTKMIQATVGIVLLINTLVFAEFLKDNVNQPPRFLGEEILTTAETVSETIQDSSFYVYNTWEHWYFLTKTLPSTKFEYFDVPMFLKYPGLQEETVNLLSKNPPTYILKQSGNYNPKTIDQFVFENYRLEKEINQNYSLYRLK